MNANEVARGVKPKIKKDMPVGAAQKTILDALEITGVAGFTHAKQIFEALGLEVGYKRVGRASVPVVKILPRKSFRVEGGWNPGGEDGWSTETEVTYPEVDFSPIAKYVEA